MFENNNDKYNIGQHSSLKEIFEYLTKEYGFVAKNFKSLFLKHPNITKLSINEIKELTTLTQKSFDLSQVL